MLTLRHTFASQLLMTGAPILEVQGYMGHRDASTTLKVYSHFIPRQESDSITRFATQIFPFGHFLDKEAVSDAGNCAKSALSA